MKATWILCVQLLLFQMCATACGASELDLGENIYARAVWALQHVFSTSYRHNNKTPDEQVKENLRTGELTAATDSSGFLSWVLFSVSPGHLFAIQESEPDKECPRPDTFAHFFATIPRRTLCLGWLNVPSALELVRGDVIALGGAGGKNSGNGRVMIAATSASEVKTVQIDGQQMQYVSVAVIDSSPNAHFGPEKLPPLSSQKQRDGIGMGWVRIFVDEHGKPIAISLGESDQNAAACAQGTVLGMARVVGPPQFLGAQSGDLDYGSGGLSRRRRMAGLSN